MIVRMSGLVSEVHEGYAVLDHDGIGYEVLICGYAESALSACLGQEITLHTTEYLEGNAVGGNMIPRLIGFPRPEERAFFARFITVKGMGMRKAMRALAVPVGQVAGAIEAGNARALSALPGIGKRMADQIIAELKGKVGEFASADVRAPTGAASSLAPEQADALEVMIALGERRHEAQQWLERAVQLHPEAHGTDEWVRLAYRVRSGTER